MSLVVTRGGDAIRGRLTRTCDVVVVGSGPAGATVARGLARRGLSVVVVEEGRLVEPTEFPADGFSAMARLYRAMGGSVTMGNVPMPYIQGRVVGGTSVINGAISWRLPDDVRAGWVAADPALEGLLDRQEIERLHDLVEAELGIAPTPPAIAGPNNLLLAAGAEALGLEHRPISRNVRGCHGLGRCLQGCPEGNKQSMDRVYLPEAVAAGAEILAECRVDAIVVERGQARGVVGETRGGAVLDVRARRGVVLAASAVQTPVLLIRSGLRQGPVGQGFACHPGASMAGRFSSPVRMWEGATQGHEVIGLRGEGLKFEALGYDIALTATRLKGFGRALASEIDDIAHRANWGVAIKAAGRGVVRPTGNGGARVRYSLTADDLRKVRRGVSLMGRMMLAAGADFVTPGVQGFEARIDDPRRMEAFEREGTLDPKAYAMAVTHMFGTARMGGDPATSVVRPDFRHHSVDGLWVADSSVFPSNTGVNPQTSIIVLAMRCAEAIAGA